MTNPTLVSSLDDILGPASRRYFGSRYLHETLTMQWDTNELVVGSTGSLRVEHGAGWSTKSNAHAGDAHLSTLDAISVADRFLHDHVPAVAVERLTLSAPSQPVERLDHIPLRLTRSTDKHIGIDIGGMQVGLAVAGPTGDAQWAEPRTFPMTTEQISLESVAIGPLTTTSEGSIDNVDDKSRLGGVIGFTLAAAQLAQVHIYSLEKMHRDQSNTLWMRRLVVEHVPTHTPHPVLTLTSRNSVDFRGARWALYDYSMSWLNWAATFAVAHALPESS